MSHAIHQFFEVKDDVYKDENNSFFGGEIVSQNNLELQWEDLRFLRNIGSHENIERFFIWCKFYDNSVRKLTELCDGNLKDYVERNLEMIPRTQYYSDMMNTSSQDPRQYFMLNREDLPLCLDLLHQTAKGLKYLHDKEIIHRNIQPSNVLLIRTSQNQTVAKLGGFRFCKKLKDKLYINQAADDSPSQQDETAKIYMAKESHEGLWSKSSDIFAFGILTYYTLTTEQRHPFYAEQGQNDIEKIMRNIASNEKAQIKIKDLASRTEEEKFTQKSMIEQLVDHNPDNRQTIDAVLFHPTFYTPKRKLEFFLKVRESVENFWTDVEEEKDKELKKKIQKALKNNKMTLNPDTIFENYPYLTDVSLRVKNGWQPVQDFSGNFQIYLKGLRNKVAHACENKGTPEQFKTHFGVTKDSYNPGKFVEIFVTNHFPKLLVDLYNIYRGYTDNYAAEFYPPTAN